MSEQITVSLPSYQWEAILRGLASSGWESMHAVLSQKLAAGVVAEEPEWEWMVTTKIPEAPTFASHATDEESARAMLRWSAEDGLERALHRRRMAGPWVPVEQGAGS